MEIKSTKDLRAFLVSQLEGIADGKIAPENAKGIANISQQIYNTINLELRMSREKTKHGDNFKRTNVSFD